MVTNLQLPECFVGTVTPTISRERCLRNYHENGFGWVISYALYLLADFLSPSPTIWDWYGKYLLPTI